MQLRSPIGKMLRSPRHVLLSLAVIALGAGVLFAANGLVRHIDAGIKEDAVEQTGAFQIASATYWVESGTTSPEHIPFSGPWTAGGPLSEALLSPERVMQIAAVLDASPDVATYTPQVMFESHIRRDSGTRVLSGIGVDPSQPSCTGYAIVEGEDLKPGDYGVVVLGEATAEELDVAVDDYVPLSIPAFCGGYTLRPLRVAGIYSGPGGGVGSQFAYVPMEFAQHVLDNTTGIHKIVVRLTDVTRIEAVTASLSTALATSGIDLELRTWDSLSTTYGTMRVVLNAVLGVIGLVVVLLVVLCFRKILAMPLVNRACITDRKTASEQSSYLVPASF